VPIERKAPLGASFPQFRSVKDDAAATGINMVVFAPPGIGKTTFLASAAKLYPNQVLLFDTDIGRESILDMDVHFAEPPKYLEAVANGQPTEGISRQLTWQELRGYLDTALALKDNSPYKVYGFDSLSSIYYELLFPMIERKMASAKDARQLYFEAQKEMTKFVRDAKSLCEYGIHTIFTGHTLEEKDEEITNVRLALPQGIRNQILLTVNHVGYMNRKKNSEDREIYFTPPRRVEGPKLRQPKTGKQVPLHLDNPDLEGIIRMMKKGS